MMPAGAEKSVRQLPPEVAALVRRVTKATRLRRQERADVMAELTSHFEEAIAAGKSPAGAIDAFGNPKEAARALRMAAIAKRSAIDRALCRAFRWTGWSIAAVALTYVGFGAYLTLQRPVIRFDAVAAAAAAVTKPARPEDAAWPAYRQALIELDLGVGNAEHQSPAHQAVQEGPWPIAWKGLPPDPWPLAATWVDEHATAIAALRAATAKPVLGFPVGGALEDADAALFRPDLVEATRFLAAGGTPNLADLSVSDAPGDLPMPRSWMIRLPHLAPMRAAARILAVDARRAAELGDGDRAVADLEAMVAMSVHCQDGRILICDLVGRAIRAMARANATAILEWKPDLLSEAQLARVQHAFEGVPPALQALDLSLERMMFADVLQCLWTDDGSGNGWYRNEGAVIDGLIPKTIVPQGREGTASIDPDARKDLLDPDVLVHFSAAARPLAALAVADRRQAREFAERWFDRWKAMSDLTLKDCAEVDRLGAQFDAEMRSEGSRMAVVRLALVDFGRAGFALAAIADRARCEAVGAACAASRFRRVHGRWPTSAEELVPDFMQSVPVDGYTGTPVSMAGEGSAFRIWSVGQNRRDDGGVGGAAGIEPTTGDLPGDEAVDWVWFAPNGTLDRWLPAASE